MAILSHLLIGIVLLLSILAPFATAEAANETYCVREALVALAHWRDDCDRGGLPPMRCWGRAPSAEQCCGQWVSVTDSRWHKHPPMREKAKGINSITHQEEEVWVPRVKDSGKSWEPLMLEDFDPRGKHRCSNWRVQEPKKYKWFLEHLENFLIKDADRTGMVIGETLPRYDPENKEPFHAPNGRPTISKGGARE